MTASHRKSTGVRRASSYKPVELTKVDTTLYPFNSSSSIGALHDVGYFQGLLSNANNYSQDS